jgi:hypothetical protein
VTLAADMDYEIDVRYDAAALAALPRRQVDGRGAAAPGRFPVDSPP